MKLRLAVRDMGLWGVQFAWECDLGHGDALPLIHFFIEVGEGTEGPWSPVNGEPIVGAFGYIGDKKYQSSVGGRTNYRIRAVNHGRGREESCSDVVPSYEHAASSVGRHIAKQERLMLRRVGFPTLHYARMHFGERCRCYDESGIRIAPNVCRECFGTGFRGGYYHPTLIRVTRGQMDKTSGPSQFGAQENPMSECWTSNEAIIEPNDLLVDWREHGRRHIVKQVRATSMHGVTVRQTLSMQRVGANGPEMLVPVADSPADLGRGGVFRRSRGAV